MNIQQLRKFCLALPYVTEDVKWGNDLCFCIGKKMFAVTGIETDNNAVSFKCTPEKFAELVEIDTAIRKATSRHNEFLKELGLPPLP